MVSCLIVSEFDMVMFVFVLVLRWLVVDCDEVDDPVVVDVEVV